MILYYEHRGVEYSLQPGKRGLILMIWNKLVEQYIFETGFCKSKLAAQQLIDDLIQQRFLIGE